MKSFFNKNKQEICSLIIIFLTFLLIFPLVSSSSENLEKIEEFLQNKLGGDFIENYVGEPIINPVVDPSWDSFDVEKAKQSLGKDNLSSVKNIIIYPIKIDDIESSFRIIVFEDDSFYSELTSPINSIIRKDKAIELAKKEGMEEPFNVILMTNDDFFGWNILSSKDSSQIEEGEVSQVIIDLRTGNINPTVFNPIRYDEKNDGIILIWIILIAIGIIIFIYVLLYVKGRKKDEKIK